MKIFKYLSILLFTSFLIASCGTEEEKMECEFKESLCNIVPFCSWPPNPNASIQLPVAFQYNGDFVSHEDYSFKWSSNPDFGSGTIGLWYDDLPVTVVVTELATGCEVEVSLSAI